MGLLKKRRSRLKKKQRSFENTVFSCAFCGDTAPPPRVRMEVFSGDGCLGGRCECSAVYVVDSTGKDGGTALLDAQALACEGDLDRVMTPEADFEVRTRDLGARDGSDRVAVSGYMPPKVWFLKLKG